MGVLDFLATAGRGSMVGDIAEASGGARQINPREAQLNQSLTKLYDEMDQSTSTQGIRDVGRKMLQSWTAAGLPLNEHAIKALDSMTQAALKNLNDKELESIQRDYGSRPAQPQPPGTEGPLTQQGNFVDPQAARNPLADPEGAMRVARATGSNPEQFRHFLGSPAELASKETSTRKTQQELEANQTKQTELEGLSNIPPERGGISPRQMGVLNPAGLPNFNPQRAPADATIDLKRQGLEIQQQRLQALADRVAAGAATAAEKAELERLKFEFEKQKFADQQTSQTTTEQPVDPVRHLQVSAAIAKRAADSGKTDPASLASFANELGYDLEGSPTVNIPGIGSALANKFAPEGAVETSPRLKGEFNLKPKAKTVTKTRPGTGTATGGQPAPQGGAPAAPKVGTVVRGYRFKGGDPSQQANWEQVR